MRTVSSSEILFVRGVFLERGRGRERPMMKLYQILHLVASVGSVGLVKLPPVCTSGVGAGAGGGGGGGEDVP